MLYIDPSLTIAEDSRFLAQYHEDQKTAGTTSSATTISPSDTVTIGGRSAYPYLNFEQDIQRATAALSEDASFERVLSGASAVIPREILGDPAVAFANGTFSRIPEEDVKKLSKQIAEAQFQSTVQPDFENATNSMTTAGGLRVDTVTSSRDKTVQASVTVTRANGQSVSFEADDNVRINEREDGSLAVVFAGTGEIRVYAADGGMTTEQGESNEEWWHWKGTDGDDVFLLLRTGSEINAGAGDDSMLVLTSTSSVTDVEGNNHIVIGSGGSARRITTGSGNDTVIGERVGDVNLGDGDNEIRAHWARDVKLGDGNNTVTIDTPGFITAGDGNNIIKVDRFGSYGEFKVGDGDNNIMMNYFMGHDFRVGNGNNNIEIYDLIKSPLRTGNGDNIITVGNIAGSSLELGTGNNKFSAVGYDLKSMKSYLNGVFSMPI
jgi:hypothetical protein